jgi:hypothetical protein
MTAYMVLTHTGNHEPGDVITDSSLLDPGIWTPMEKSVVMGRLISLHSVRLATTDEVTAAGTNVVPLSVGLSILPSNLDGSHGFGT